MKNFKKFTVKALSKDDLSKIKGGATNMTCEEAYESCSRNPEICIPGAPTEGWYECMEDLNPNCSPLTGWEIWCGYGL